MDPHENGSACYGADRSVRVSVSEASAAFGKIIEHRRLSILISVAAEPLGGIILTDDPENIGFISGERESGKKENE